MDLPCQLHAFPPVSTDVSLFYHTCLQHEDLYSTVSIEENSGSKSGNSSRKVVFITWIQMDKRR